MNHSFRVLALFSLGLVLYSYPAVSNASPPHTGIQGQAFLYLPGPPPVQLPVATSFNVLSARTRNPLARVTTDANGVYKLSLHPGTYLLIPETVVLDPRLNCTVSTGPIEVTVRSRRYTLANIFYLQPMPCGTAGVTPARLGEPRSTAQR